jgi:hypothetical protein
MTLQRVNIYKRFFLQGVFFIMKDGVLKEAGDVSGKCWGIGARDVVNL